MAKSITLLGATYSDVPAVTLPQTGGGTATFYEYEEVLEMFYPVGSIYMSTSSTAPDFGGTWREVKITATWSDLQNNVRNFVAASSSGTVHYWQRIA